MKALVHTKPFEFEMQDREVPKIKNDEVLIQVKAVGICGSDVHGISGKTGRRQPPIIMGHEASGIVNEIGRNVKNYRTGDRVTFDSTVYCDRCFYCLRGQVNLCENRKVLGVACDEYRMDGAMAEYVAVPERILTPMPEGMSFHQAAMIEPVTIAYHGVERAAIRLNDVVAVMGCGIIGLFIIQVARIACGGKIIALDIDDRKLEKAGKLGADLLLNPTKVDLKEEIGRHTEGRGVDVVLEAVGLGDSVNTALGIVRKGGTFVQIGNWSPEVSLPLQNLVAREIDLRGSYASSRAVQWCVDLISAGKIDVDSLISEVAPLAEGAAWFRTLYDREKLLFKVILEP